PTGSGTIANTIGMVRVACSNGPTAALPDAKIRSGVSATNSAAFLRLSSRLPVDQRASTLRLRPSIQPNCCNPSLSAARLAFALGSSAENGQSTPIRRTGSGCCARAVSGHAITPPPITLMKARRLIAAPERLEHKTVATRRCAEEGVSATQKEYPLWTKSGHQARSDWRPFRPSITRAIRLSAGHLQTLRDRQRDEGESNL